MKILSDTLSWVKWKLRVKIIKLLNRHNLSFGSHVFMGTTRFFFVVFLEPPKFSQNCAQFLPSLMKLHLWVNSFPINWEVIYPKGKFISEIFSAETRSLRLHSRNSHQLCLHAAFVHICSCPNKDKPTKALMTTPRLLCEQILSFATFMLLGGKPFWTNLM